MDLEHIVLYFILGLSLFFLLHYFYLKENENYSIYAVLPIIYIVVLAGIFKSIGYDRITDYLYVVIVLEAVIHLYYDKVILKREEFHSGRLYAQIYSISIIGGYFINRVFISQVDCVFLTASEMRMAIWIFIIWFLYITFKGQLQINFTFEQASFISRKRKYVLVNYAKLKHQYLNVVKCKNKNLVPLVYAMMIYENYHRPDFFRKIDRIIYRFQGKETKMGIMQIISSHELSDEESIQLAIKKLHTLDANIKNSKHKIRDIVKDYYLNSDMIQDVLDIYDTIVEFNQS